MEGMPGLDKTQVWVIAGLKNKGKVCPIKMNALITMEKKSIGAMN